VGTRSWAAFAQGDIGLATGLRLILGARYTTEKNTLDQNFQTTSLNPATLGANSPGFPIVFSMSRRDNAFTPKVGLNFQVSEDVFLYASATRGFKSGGFNGQATAAATAGFAPEFIWSYEAGAKTEWLDRRLRLNLTGFYYDYTDLQVRQLLGPGNSVIANAASATVKGIELEVVAKPDRDFQISGSLSYLDAKYDRFPAAAIPGAFAPFVPNQNCVGTVCTINVSGNRLSDAPRWSGLVAADYSPSLGGYQLAVHADYAFRASRFFDLSNIPLSRQGAYGLLNASIGAGPNAATGWKLELSGRNLLDEEYYQTISGNGLAPGAIVGDPRTYGIRATYSW
jgi:iron complex outermembrane receptor protein